jgi:ABC-type glycerol-3-phosphate transport system substrate-binding protein
MTSSNTLKRATMLASLVAMLVACGGQATPTTAPTTAPEPTAATEATAAPAAEEPTATMEAAATEAATAEATTETTTASGTTEMKKYKGQIVISTNGANPDRTRFTTLIEAYNKLQPDVKVIVEAPPSGVDYAQWLGTQLAAGAPSDVRPDIVSGNYQPTYANYVNLDKYILGTNPYTGNAWNEDVDWSFWQERNTRGERIMLPTEAVHILWFYNKDILDKAGVQPPTTWDELVTACEKIEAATNVKCVGSNYSYKLNQWIPEIYWDQYARDIIDIVRCQPGDYCYDETVDGTFKFDANDVMVEGKYNKNFSRYYAAIRDGKIKFDTPEMADMVRNLAKVFPKHASDSLFVDSTEYSQFLQGQVAVMIDGTWSLGGLTRDMKSLTSLTAERMKDLGIKDSSKLKPFEWGTFENPAMTGPLVKFPNVRSIESATGVYGSIIDKSAEQTEMVLDFLMFWFSKPGYQAYVDGDMQDPTTPGGYSPSGPVMVKGVTIPDDYQKLMSNVKMMGNVENGLFLPLRFNVDSIDKEAQNKLKDALEGTITPEEYASWLQKTWTDNFDAIIKKAGLTQADLDNPARDPAAN